MGVALLLALAFACHMAIIGGENLIRSHDYSETLNASSVKLSLTSKSDSESDDSEIQTTSLNSTNSTNFPISESSFALDGSDSEHNDLGFTLRVGRVAPARRSPTLLKLKLKGFELFRRLQQLFYDSRLWQALGRFDFVHIQKVIAQVVTSPVLARSAEYQ